MLYPLLAITAIVSWYAFQNERRKSRLMLKPYLVFERQQWERLISHAFVHGDSTHLFLNLFVLWQFGTTVELDLLSGALTNGWLVIGPESAFLALYFGGLGAAAIPALVRHRNNPNYSSLGASGAVSAVLMAYIILHPTAMLYFFFIIPMPAFVAGILFFAYEHYMNQKGNTGIAHDAHLFGVLYGLVFVLGQDPQALGRLYDSFLMLF